MSTSKAYFSTVDRVTSNPPSTLVLIGTALDGPARTPFKPNNLKLIDEIIGECPLADAYTLAYRTGLEDIIIYRLNGQHAVGSLMFNGTEVVKFTSIAASDVYNDIMIDAGPDRIIVTNLDGTQKEYLFSSYPSAGLMADAMNLDANFGLIEFTAQANDPTFLLDVFDDSNEYAVIFNSGSTEPELVLDRRNDVSSQLTTLDQRLKDALFGEDLDDQVAYEPNSMLGLLEYGVICLVDMFHDDPVSFTNSLAMFCQNKGATEGAGCIGVIGVTPLFDTSATGIASKVLSLRTKSPSKGSTAPVPVDIQAASPMSYIQIIIGDTNLSSIIGQTVLPTSVCYSYAAAQALLPYYNSMTNKSLQGINYINYEFEKKDVEDLSSNGYISIVSSIRKGFVPYRSVTAIGNKDRMLASPSVVRITQQVTKQVVDYLEDYIGSTGSSLKRKAMENGVDEVMKSFVDIGVIRAYSIAYEYTMLTSDARVRLTIVPYSDVGTVSTTVNMPFNPGVI